MRGGLLDRFTGGDAITRQLAAVQTEDSRGRQYARQDREGKSAETTDATTNPGEVVGVVMSLPPSAAVTNDG